MMTKGSLTDCDVLRPKLSISAAPRANLSVRATTLLSKQKGRKEKLSCSAKADLPVFSSDDSGKGRKLKSERLESKTKSWRGQEQERQICIGQAETPSSYSELVTKRFRL